MDAPIPHPLPDPVIELVAQRFRVLGEPMRIRILEHLRDGEATVQDLTAALESSQQNISKHLRVLLESGVLSRRKAGTFAYYAVSDPDVYALCETVCGGLQRQADAASQALRLS